MTNPEATQQDTELDPKSSTDETTSGADLEAAGEEGVAADYQERLKEFDNVESVPIASVPVDSSQLDESDLKLGSPGNPATP